MSLPKNSSLNRGVIYNSMGSVLSVVTYIWPACSSPWPRCVSAQFQFNSFSTARCAFTLRMYIYCEPVEHHNQLRYNSILIEYKALMYMRKIE